MNTKKIFDYDEDKIKCPVTAATGIIGGKWKPIILYVLTEDVHRFGQIKKRLPKITQKMLTQMLRELEMDGVISRKVYAEVPSKVEYSLTGLGETLRPVLDLLHQWGEEFALNDPEKTSN